jgi:hypothetical protein
LIDLIFLLGIFDGSFILFYDNFLEFKETLNFGDSSSLLDTLLFNFCLSGLLLVLFDESLFSLPFICLKLCFNLSLSIYSAFSGSKFSFLLDELILNLLFRTTRFLLLEPELILFSFVYNLLL